MKAQVVRIGNPRGIRIPKFVIEQCQLHGAWISWCSRDNWSFGPQPKRTMMVSAVNQVIRPAVAIRIPKPGAL